MPLRIIRRCIQRRLVDEVLTEAELAELRCIRRLAGLGVNPAGVEMILRMRRQIEELQAEIARLEQLLATSMSLEVPEMRPRSLPWDQEDSE